MIVIAIIGILAAIALPAYAKYMARARFTEVTSAISGVQKQVELCIFDVGPAFTANGVVPLAGCDNQGANGASGNGWRIGQPATYATKYVATITVDGAANVIRAASTVGNGLNGETYAIQATWGAANNGIIDWDRFDNGSSCIAADLC
jgi:type IV pilus assembly protein PilA/prepilin peptidase dependent protein D